MAFPATFRRAFKVPGTASNPAWMIALFALEVPQHTSSSRSITQMSASYFDNSLAMAQPITPAPITATSYIVASPFHFPNKKARETKLPCSLIYLAHVSGIGLFIDYFYHNILRWK